MIAALLERAARRASQADVVLKTDETTRLHFGDDGLHSAAVATSLGASLRVVVEGRQGIAGTVVEDPEDLLTRALESARVGDILTPGLPSRAALPSVITHLPRAAAATLQDLIHLVEILRDRLQTAGLSLNFSVRRSLGSVRVANTHGLDAGYDVSLVDLRLRATVPTGGRRLTLTGRLVGADLPSLPELEQLVRSLRLRLAWATRTVPVPAGRHRVAFSSAALPTLLRPVEQGLNGAAALLDLSPLAHRRGARAFSESITLRDDPLLDGRPGSRPFDDEGLPSRPVALVERGQIAGLLYDLETAARAGVPSTGHGRRTTFGRAQVVPSNIVLEPGTADENAVLAAIGDGIVVERLRGSPDASQLGGSFALPALVAWRVLGGEIVGVVPEVTVAGNAHELLNRVVAVGRDAEWQGSRWLPPVVIEGVSVF